MMLAQRLYEEGIKYAEGWNFGPNDDDAKNVGWIVDKICNIWGGNSGYTIDPGEHPHEANYLKLDCSKAKTKLGWSPKWDIDMALLKVVEWSRGYMEGTDMRKLCIEQIEEYMIREC